MPRQILSEAPQIPHVAADTAPRSIWLRRSFVFGCTGLLTSIAGWQMYEVLKVGGLTPLEGLILALFIPLSAWIALSFLSSCVGFFCVLSRAGGSLPIDTRRPLPNLEKTTALLLPAYNEAPHRVFGRLRAIYQSLEQTGMLAHFDFFVLSDSRDPEIWLREEEAFLQFRKEVGSPRLYYRHRQQNTERKAGNIAEWVTRFGGHYEFMIVLDADSLMDGDTIVRLARAMEDHPRVGLIQTVPRLLNAKTLFARIQQFAGSIYGGVVAAGVVWWYGTEGNYWGHNAIIRIEAFASSAGLPLLRGPKNFGGHVLSHDFVEAALMRRAGWAIHVVPELRGSYEEVPPTLTDYAIRDRRWCQGNLQHAAVLHAKGLHWVSRLHLLTGIGSYLTAPLWFLFLITGMLISLQAEFIRPEYFPRGATLFPQWPAQDPVRAAYVFAAAMAMLLVPKLLGWLAAALDADRRRGMGGGIVGFASVIIEIVISALLAPILMIKQCRAVAEILTGRDAGWAPQRRDEGATLSEAVRVYRATTLVGLALALAAYAVSASLLAWMLPVVAGLVLAVPVAHLTGTSASGLISRRAGLLLIADERRTPAVSIQADEFATVHADAAAATIFDLLMDLHFVEAHKGMIGQPQRRRKGDIDLNLLAGVEKIKQADDAKDALRLLTTSELFAILGHRAAFEQLLCKRSIA